MSRAMTDDMKDEYDFSKAERGRFYRKDAVLAAPVHLEPEVLTFLTARAQARGISVNALVNELLKKDIELIEAAE
jgi:predicted HicB family RNase H-like nuclease